MKKTILTLSIITTLFISYGQDKVNGNDRNQEKLSQIRQAVANKPMSVQDQMSLRNQARVKDATLKKSQDATNTERAKLLESRRTSPTGKASVLSLQQTQEHRASATLTPEQNEARIQRMNQYKEMIKARENGVTSPVTSQPSSTLRPATLLQPVARPATTIEKGVSPK